MNVPMVDLKVQYASLKDEIQKAMAHVLEETSFIMGAEVKELEKSIAAYAGVKHGVGVGSGTEALHISLLGCGIKPGDEVIVPTFTFIATAEVVSLIGATPVFCDIDPRTFTMDPKDVEKRITSKTRCIIPVHLYGQPAPMDELLALAKSHHLMVIEDCAQSMGSRWKGTMTGTLGDTGCLSFFPSKNLGGYGDGGMILTNRDDVAEKIRAIRVHGSNKKYFHHILGLNSRLDTLQAAILLVKLGHLDEWNERRRHAASLYDRALAGTLFIAPPVLPEVTHVFHQYTIRTARRDELQQFLKERGIASMIYYPLSLHLQEVFSDCGCKKGDLPVAERAQDEVLSLPMFPEITDDQVNYVASALQDFQHEKLKGLASGV
jgi:dTDP-4-amino-4,6-dideoxygalactose transaminase